MKKLKSLVFLSLLMFSSLPLLALCAQASPINCPSFTAVACHNDAVESFQDTDFNHALVEVRGADGRILDQQSIHCNETGRVDPYDVTTYDPAKQSP